MIFSNSSARHRLPKKSLFLGNFNVWRISRRFLLALSLQIIALAIIMIFWKSSYKITLGSIYINGVGEKSTVVWTWEIILIVISNIALYLSTTHMQTWEFSGTRIEAKFSRLIFPICLLLSILPIVASYLFAAFIYLEEWVQTLRPEVQQAVRAKMPSPFTVSLLRPEYLQQQVINIVIFVSLTMIFLLLLRRKILAPIFSLLLYVLSIQIESRLGEWSIRDPYYSDAPNTVSIVLSIGLFIAAVFLNFREYHLRY
jgi:hypothetical protein